MNVNPDNDVRAAALDEIEDALHAIERFINFYPEEEFRENFPMIRRAIIKAQRSALILRTPVILNVDPEPPETLSICVQANTGERTVTAVPVEQPSVTMTTDAVGSLSSDRFPASDRFPSLSERVQRRIQRRLQYEVQPQVPMYNFPAHALMGIINRQENAARERMTPDCHRIGQYNNSPPEYHTLFPEGPPAQFRIPSSPPPMHAEAVGERIRDLSSAEVYGKKLI